MNENASVTSLKGVGEKTAKYFEKLDIRTIGELLCHYPRDYETFQAPGGIAELRAGTTGVIRASVAEVSELRRVRNLTILSVRVQDASGAMTLTFFNQPYLKNVLKPGSSKIFRGPVRIQNGRTQITAPRIYVPEEYLALVDELQPRYALTKGLTNAAVTKAVRAALREIEWDPEMFGGDLMAEMRLIPHAEAVRRIHFPDSAEELSEARRRLAFEEFFFFLLLLRRNRELTESAPNVFPMIETADTARLLEALPFRLTGGQKKAWRQIAADLTGDQCMNRLVQGDVGSGKTIVALLALLQCAANGYQGALMAPTEVLAMQHFETVRELTARYGLIFRPELLVGSMGAAAKREARGRIASGESNLVIGTHALIQDKVEYAKLALVVTDEQHRFGVRQRESLAKKGGQPHILVMSATPIPRTLAIVLYGDLQVSTIRELPANRLPIKNTVVGEEYRPSAYAFLEKQVKEGHQVYIICPQVEAGENSDLENVEEYTEKLRTELPPFLRIGLLHGQLRPADKNRIMDEFAAGNIDILVSTTVVEVGINVPNATVMMIENAERFGLAQLHQLRGRIGRGDAQSYCIFLSGKEDEKTRKRLEILNRTNDGFEIAQEDLRLRGPGELYGVRQSGELAFEIADIFADADVLTLASEAVEALLAEDKHLKAPEHAGIREAALRFQRYALDFRSI